MQIFKTCLRTWIITNVKGGWIIWLPMIPRQIVGFVEFVTNQSNGKRSLLTILKEFICEYHHTLANIVNRFSHVWLKGVDISMPSIGNRTKSQNFSQHQNFSHDFRMSVNSNILLIKAFYMKKSVCKHKNGSLV